MTNTAKIGAAQRHSSNVPAEPVSPPAGAKYAKPARENQRYQDEVPRENDTGWMSEVGAPRLANDQPAVQANKIIDTISSMMPMIRGENGASGGGKSATR